MRSRTLTALLVAVALATPVAPTAAVAHDAATGKAVAVAKNKKAKHEHHKRGHDRRGRDDHDHDRGKGKKRGHERHHERNRAMPANGLVTGVDPAAATLTFVVRSSRDTLLHGRTLTVPVATTAKVTRNEEVATLGGIFVYDAVAVKLVKVDAGYLATRVSAEGPGVAPAPSPEPTAPTTGPSEPTEPPTGWEP